MHVRMAGSSMVNRRCRRGVAAQARRGGRAPPGDCCGSRGHVRMAIGSDHAALAERWFKRQPRRRTARVPCARGTYGGGGSLRPPPP
jgi:hypothetical protein